MANDTIKKSALTVQDITLIGMMVAVIEVSKVALSGLPNVELTSFWIIMFSLYLGKRVYYAVPVFILVEGLMYGIQIWWIMYLYAWPLLALLAKLLRKMDSALSWAILSGAFGLSFGLLCAIPYFFIGAAGATVADGLRYAFAWWIAGIPWDFVHGAGNFVIMLVLYHPIGKAMKTISSYLQKSRRNA